MGEVGLVLPPQELVQRALAEVLLRGPGIQRGGQEAVRDMVGGAVDAAQPLEFDDVVRPLEGQFGGDGHRGGDDPLGEHRGAHLGALFGHHRVEPGDPVHEALAVLVPDRRPCDVGAPSLLTDQVTVGDQAVHRAPQGDPADAVLRAQHRLRREQGVLRQ